MCLKLTTFLCAALIGSATTVHAEGLRSVFDQNVGPNLDGSITYTQNWSAAYLTETFDGVSHIYVRGDGKLGTFHGVLELNCPRADASRWLALGGVLEAGMVPAEAIRGIRQAYC